MLLFGHAGITLGSAVLLAKLLPYRSFSGTTGNTVIQSHSASARLTESQGNLQGHLASWLGLLGNNIDIRVLIIGSLLPDIIDKPLGYLFFRNAIGTGIAFAHSLLSLFLVTLAGAYLYKKYGKTGLPVISFGVFTHLIFDEMWLKPRTLFWPLNGFTFARGDATTWIPGMLEALMTDPQVYIPELVGLAVLVWFLLTLVWSHKVFYFLKWGRVQ